MCEFLSWTKYKGRLHYLTNFDLNTRQGKKLKKELNYSFYEQIVGHGAIKEYFGLPHAQCKDYECTDFSSPDNFPAEIVAKIKAGEFSQIGIAKEILTKSAQADYEKIERSAWAKYKKIWQSARAKYEKIERSTWSAWDDYEKTNRSALDKFKKIERSAFWKLFSNSENRIRLWR